jgi:hypothetical protein
VDRKGGIKLCLKAFLTRFRQRIAGPPQRTQLDTAEHDRNQGSPGKKTPWAKKQKPALSDAENR